MTDLVPFLAPAGFGLAFVIALIAGTIKGLVGFAMPMIMVSGLSSIMAPDLALAGLILPTLATNGFQALRQGPRAAWESMHRFRAFLLIGGMFLLISAQLVRVLPTQVMLLIIGGPITLFALTQLMGKQLTLAAPSRRMELSIGAFAGFIGGFSGIWGPPTVAYLTALGTEKREQMRIQGVIYGLGAVVLFFAHIGSGVMRSETWPFSVLMILPALMGMWIGGQLQDKIDQKGFRRATLFVLLIAGLNLLRRAAVG